MDALDRGKFIRKDFFNGFSIFTYPTIPVPLLVIILLIVSRTV